SEGGRRLWTVGHSTLTLAAFLDRIRDLEVVADVRRYPVSRRFPHFNAESLARIVEYRHFPALGGRRRGGGERHRALRSPGFRAYAAHMETPEFRSALADLEALAAARRTVLLCAEAVWFRCHRMLLADLLTARGWTVLHRPGDRPHRLNPAARVEDGGVVYDCTPPAE
ncbi:MAG: DUF488 family protein, partial [Planctomycetota bacterium]